MKAVVRVKMMMRKDNLKALMSLMSRTWELLLVK